jgi:hypothetical protein
MKSRDCGSPVLGKSVSSLAIRLLPATFRKISDGTIILILKVGDLSEKRIARRKPNRNDFPRTDELANPSLKCGFRYRKFPQPRFIHVRDLKGDTFAIRESKIT